MIKHLFVLLTFVTTFFNYQSLNAQEQLDTIKWLSWTEAVTMAEAEPRKIIMEVYTDWCIWCKRMEKQTFNNQSIVKYINDNYYPVRFNAEEKDEIEYEDKVYKFVKSGNNGYHELAAELLKGRLTFPTIVFMDEDLDVIQSLAGYKTPMQFMHIETYFGDDRHRNTPWATYKKSFVPNLRMVRNKD
ncbi:MAG: DUF255 domain-containing protein [Bacteroidota bacterium]